jgi:hypothetical protein
MSDVGRRARALRSLGILAGLGACGVAHAEIMSVATTAQNHINETFSTFADLDFRFSTWQGTRGTNVFAPERGKGTQYYAPLSLGLTYERAERFASRPR